MRRRVCRQVPLALPLTTSGRYRARCRLGCLPPPSGPLKPRPAIRVTKRPIDGVVQLVVVNCLRSRPRKLAFFVGGGKMVEPTITLLEIPSRDGEFFPITDFFSIKFKLTISTGALYVIICYYLPKMFLFEILHLLLKHQRKSHDKYRSNKNKETCKMLVIPHH